MKTENINGVEVEFYMSGEEMTMKRYQRFNKYLMIDNEVGSDFGEFNNRFAKGVAFLKKRMIDDGVKELDNFRQMVYNAFTEYNPKGVALALLVRRIGDQEYKDITAGGLNKVLDKLEEIGFTQGTTNRVVTEVKKK